MKPPVFVLEFVTLVLVPDVSSSTTTPCLFRDSVALCCGMWSVCDKSLEKSECCLLPALSRYSANDKRSFGALGDPSRAIYSQP